MGPVWYTDESIATVHQCSCPIAQKAMIRSKGRKGIKNLSIQARIQNNLKLDKAVETPKDDTLEAMVLQWDASYMQGEKHNYLTETGLEIFAIR